MHITIALDTNEDLSPKDKNLLSLLIDAGEVPASVAAKVSEPAAKEAPAKKAPAKKAAAKKPEPEPEPEPIAEEPVPEEEPEVVEADVVEADDEDESDEDLLARAVKKATEMVAGGKAAQVREALDAAGASRVRELNADNVREFFKALP